MHDTGIVPAAAPDDEFDGHGRYLDEFEPVRRDEGLWGSPWRAFDSLLALGILIGVTAAVFEASPCGDGCDGPGGLIFLFGGFVAGSVAGGIFLAITRRFEHDWKWRGLFEAAAVLWVMTQVVAPARQAADSATDQRRARDLEYVMSASSPAQAAWLESLRRDGLHGPPGTLPPGIAVVARADAVEVINEGQETVSIGLARVIPDANGPAGWSGCPLLGRLDDVTRGNRVTVEPGASIRFEADERCAVTHADGAFEWRIGAHEGDHGWWSNSALAVPIGWSAWLDTVRR